MTIYGDLLTLVVLQPSWTDESWCTGGNTTVFSVEFLQQLTGRSWLSGFYTVHWCTCCLFCQRMCSIHTFAISKKLCHVGKYGCGFTWEIMVATQTNILKPRSLIEYCMSLSGLCGTHFDPAIIALHLRPTQLIWLALACSDQRNNL